QKATVTVVGTDGTEYSPEKKLTVDEKGQVSGTYYFSVTEDAKVPVGKYSLYLTDLKSETDSSKVSFEVVSDDSEVDDPAGNDDCETTTAPTDDGDASESPSETPSDTDTSKPTETETEKPSESSTPTQPMMATLRSRRRRLLPRPTRRSPRRPKPRSLRNRALRARRRPTTTRTAPGASTRARPNSPQAMTTLSPKTTPRLRNPRKTP